MTGKVFWSRFRQNHTQSDAETDFKRQSIAWYSLSGHLVSLLVVFRVWQVKAFVSNVTWLLSGHVILCSLTIPYYTRPANPCLLSNDYHDTCIDQNVFLWGIRSKTKRGVTEGLSLSTNVTDALMMTVITADSLSASRMELQRRKADKEESSRGLRARVSLTKTSLVSKTELFSFSGKRLLFRLWFRKMIRKTRVTVQSMRFLQISSVTPMFFFANSYFRLWLPFLTTNSLLCSQWSFSFILPTVLFFFACWSIAFACAFCWFCIIRVSCHESYPSLFPETQTRIPSSVHFSRCSFLLSRINFCLLCSKLFLFFDSLLWPWNVFFVQYFLAHEDSTPRV